MISFVHLAPEKLRRRVQRSGLRGQQWAISTKEGPLRIDEAIFAMPVLPEFHLTHQWMRELRRWRGGRFVAVHFAISAEHRVYVGRYGQPHELLEAGNAVRWVRENPKGAEVVLTEAVAPALLKGIKDVRQDVGWVETPETQSAYNCVCQICIPRGTPNAIRRFRGSFLRNVERLHSSRDTDVRRDAISSMELAAERAAAKLPVERILSVASDDDENLRARLSSLLRLFPFAKVEDTLMSLCADSSEQVRCAAIEALTCAAGSVASVRLLQGRASAEDLVYLANTLVYSDAQAGEALELLGGHASQTVQDAVQVALDEWREE